MPDIRLIPILNPIAITFDWLQTPTGLLDETQQLASAILIALNTDAAADENDILPDPRDDNRRGWWGDLDAEQIWKGWPLGSKLWLLQRAKILQAGAAEGATTTRAEAYIRAAMKPFIDAGICTRVDVTATQVNEQRISASVVIYRGPKPAIRLEYQTLWDEVIADQSGASPTFTPQADTSLPATPSGYGYLTDRADGKLVTDIDAKLIEVF